MAREITCDCGEVLRAKDDEELFKVAGRHVQEKHPGLQMTEQQARDLIKQKGRTV